MDVTTLRLRLRECGYDPIPAEGKAPPMTGWSQKLGVTPDEIRLWESLWTYARNTGAIAKRTPAIDIDIMIEDAADAIEALAREQFEEPRGDTFLVRFGLAPKRLIPLRTDEPFKKLARIFTAPNGSEHKIEILADGQQWIAAGIHPDSGEAYRWFGGELTATPRDKLPYVRQTDAEKFLADAARLLVEQFGFVEKSASGANGGGPREPGDEPRATPAEIAAALAVIPNNADWDGWNNMGMACWRATGGAAEGFAAFDAWSSKSPKYDARCTAEKWAAYFRSPPTQIGAGTIFYLADQASPGWRDEPGRVLEAPKPIVGNGGDSSEDPITREDYMKGKSALASNVGNVLIALKQEPLIMRAFAYDEMLRTEVLLRPLFVVGKPNNFTTRPISDADIVAVQAYLQRLGFRRLGKATVHDGVAKHAREECFHPVRQYLDIVPWDGISRLCRWLPDGFGAELSAYNAEIGIMFMVGMVARIFQPGCKLDYMPILEGPQGLLKSSACRILAGDYFSDQLPDITNKEAFQHLRGKWLIEVAELQAYSRADIDHFKAFLVRDTERYRPPWGRTEVYEPRQCCFIGTTNKALYLKDETGNRRFWPVKCGEIDLDWLRANRDQLFAEAVHLYRAKVRWWPDAKFERKVIRAEQDARYEPDAWEGPIRAHLEGLFTKRTTVMSIATQVLNYGVGRYKTPINRLTPKDQQRITSILGHLKWEPKRKNDERWWEPISKSGDSG